MTQVDANILPFGDNIVFPNCPKDLPTHDEVRQHPDVLSYRGTVRFLDRQLVVKHGFVRKDQFYAHWLVWKFSSVPVPALYAWHHDGDEAFLYMELVDGVTLEQCWHALSSTERGILAQRLKGILAKLRQEILPPADSYIGSVPRAPCGDHSIRNLGGMGPFSSTAAFHDALPALGVRPNHLGIDFVAQLRNALPDDAPPTFTHGDLHFSNIIISPPGEGELTIRAIIDWEFAGFYPSYWEWLSFMSGLGDRAGFLDTKPFIDEVCEPFPGVWKYWREKLIYHGV
ncbi:hypothetical protein EXIGLDRAFT_736665 [Exidia glandulosa HHB12029]|uniref:Aminoglycoside phosphotransferase domain-containing protein n=1 Tax=Exidia glandulosa HHB12029 TaxID=1314781 RepID=A0A166N456_EXIGL|nr:hypothetical protein EXIGLDRAFT_736665 [Exidia glandulosa HHB12029]